jgi:DNA replication protein DnaC
LSALKLVAVAEQYAALATEAAQKQGPQVDYLARLIDSEAQRRHQLAIRRRVAAARFPCLKTLDQFDWNWPKKINRTQVQNLFRVAFLKDKTNVIFMGGVGLGKTHLVSALAHEACLQGHSVLFTTAVDIINTLTAAQTVGRLKNELKHYLKPTILAIDELGYLPIDKAGADLLFQVISQRYEQGSILLTTNQPYKHWPKIFNNDSTLTSAVLDRLLHHAETVIIDGKSYRMKDQIETP